MVAEAHLTVSVLELVERFGSLGILGMVAWYVGRASTSFLASLTATLTDVHVTVHEIRALCLECHRKDEENEN